MKTIGNVLWIILGGFEWFVGLIGAGVICCVTIIGIPVGLQLFKMALFVLWPFEKEVENISPSGFKMILNVIWAVLFGWILALIYCFIGLLFCITVIGIGFGKQYFKLASFIILPLGKEFI